LDSSFTLTVLSQIHRTWTPWPSATASRGQTCTTHVSILG